MLSKTKLRYAVKYLVVLILVSFIAGCGDKDEQVPVDDKNKFSFDSTDIKTTAAENPNENFQLSYKFEKGKNYKYRLTNIARDAQTIRTDTTIDQSVTQNIIYLIDLKLSEVDNEGVMELNCTVSSIKLDANTGDQIYSYESGKADSADQVRYSEYESIINNPFSVRISKQGEIVEIFRVDKMVNKYLSLRGYADSATVEEKNILRREIAEVAIRQLLVQIFREVPQHNVAKDSAWTKTQPPSQFMVFKAQNINTYEIENLEMLNDDKVAVIDAGLITNLTGDTKFTERGASYDFQKPVTASSGKIFFNITEGLIQKSKTRTQIDLFFTMEAPTPQGIQKGSKKQTIVNTNILELL